MESKLKDERALNKNLQEENKKLKDTTDQLEQEQKTLIKNLQEENKKLKDTTNKLEEEQKTLLKNSQEENKKLKETIYQLEQEQKTLIKNLKEEEKTMSAKNEKIYDIEKSIKTKSITELKEGEVIISVLSLSMGRQDIQNYRALTTMIRDTYGQTKGFDNLEGLNTKELNQRIDDIQNNKIMLPDFQRQFDWELEKQKAKIEYIRG